MNALDERLKELQAKRRILEEKDNMRTMTISQMEHLGSEARERVLMEVQKKVAMARERNHELLRDIGSACKSSHEFLGRSEKARTACALNLGRAKENYLKAVDVLLPGWREDLSNRRAETQLRLEKEKVRISKRRAAMQAEFQKEERERSAVESKRREVFEQLALEQQEQLEEQGRNMIRREEAQHLDGHVMRQVEDAGQALYKLLDERIASRDSSPVRPRQDSSVPPSPQTKTLQTQPRESEALVLDTASVANTDAPPSPGAPAARRISSVGPSTPNDGPVPQLSPPKPPSIAASPAAKDGDVSHHLAILDIGTAQHYMEACFPRLLMGATGEQAVGLYSAASKTKTTPSAAEVDETLRATIVAMDNESAGQPEMKDVAVALFQLMSEIGPDLLPADALTGVIGLEDMSELHSKRGRDYSLVWNLICAHIDDMLRTMSIANASSEATRVAGLFAHALTRGMNGSSAEQVRRKVNSLLVLSVLEDDEYDSDSRSPPPTTTAAPSSTAEVKPAVAPAPVVASPPKAATGMKAHEGPDVPTKEATSPTGSPKVKWQPQKTEPMNISVTEQPSMIQKGPNASSTSKANFSMTAGTINISDLDGDDDMFDEDEQIDDIPDMTDLAPSDEDA